MMLGEVNAGFGREKCVFGAGYPTFLHGKMGNTLQ